MTIQSHVAGVEPLRRARASAGAGRSSASKRAVTQRGRCRRRPAPMSSWTPKVEGVLSRASSATQATARASGSDLGRGRGGAVPRRSAEHAGAGGRRGPDRRAEAWPVRRPADRAPGGAGGGAAPWEWARAVTPRRVRQPLGPALPCHPCGMTWVTARQRRLPSVSAMSATEPQPRDPTIRFDPTNVWRVGFVVIALVAVALFLRFVISDGGSVIFTLLMAWFAALAMEPAVGPLARRMRRGAAVGLVMGALALFIVVFIVGVRAAVRRAGRAAAQGAAGRRRRGRGLGERPD